MAAAPVAQVTIAIARDPALVRTVRLVAAAVARRAGHDEELVEEVRLAVGEACALLVGSTPDEPGTEGTVEVSLGIADGLNVQVTGEAAAGSIAAEVDGTDVDPWALLRGLNDGLAVDRTDGSTAVSMSWPLG